MTFFIGFLAYDFDPTIKKPNNTRAQHDKGANMNLIQELKHENPHKNKLKRAIFNK